MTSEDTSLAALLRMLSIKQSTGMSDAAFTKVAKDYCRTLPQPNTYPSSYAAAKQRMKAIELPHVKYDACLYGCTLYYGEFAQL